MRKRKIRTDVMLSSAMPTPKGRDFFIKAGMVGGKMVARFVLNRAIDLTIMNRVLTVQFAVKILAHPPWSR
jgi:hypothetical protein